MSRSIFMLAAAACLAAGTASSAQATQLDDIKVRCAAHTACQMRAQDADGNTQVQLRQGSLQVVIICNANGDCLRKAPRGSGVPVRDVNALFMQ